MLKIIKDLSWTYLLTNDSWEVIYKTKNEDDAKIFQKHNTNKIVLVYSWGLDSTTVMYDLMDRGYSVTAMTVNYGQKHNQELEKAKYFCDLWNIPQIELDLSNVSIFQTNWLVNKDIDIKDWLYNQENVESTMVLNRNSILANYALAYAMNIKAVWIALWIHSEDVETWEIEYPDCSTKFVNALKILAKEIDFKEYEVLVPFSGKSKVDVITRWLELKVPYDKTWSCYKGGELACWKCWTCVQRLSWFRKNNSLDFIDYEPLKINELALIWYNKDTLEEIDRELYKIKSKDSNFEIKLKKEKWNTYIIL